MPSTGAADADTLHAVTIRSRTLAAAAISKGSASLMTELMTARLALIEVLDGYRDLSTVRATGDGYSAKVANHRFTVLPPCYELITLLMRTLTYTRGQSGSARRDLHGQANDSSLYVRICASNSHEPT